VVLDREEGGSARLEGDDQRVYNQTRKLEVGGDDLHHEVPLGGVFDFEHHLLVLVLRQRLELYLLLIRLKRALRHVCGVGNLQLTRTNLTSDYSAKLHTF